jgi:hypothetical protein
MVREEFICDFMEVTQIDMEAACKNFRTVNMIYLLVNTVVMQCMI